MYTPIDSSPGQLNKNFYKLLVSLISLPLQLQKVNFKVRQHGSLKIEESVYIKNSNTFLLVQSSNMEEKEHKDVYI